MRQWAQWNRFAKGWRVMLLAAVAVVLCARLGAAELDIYSAAKVGDLARVQALVAADPGAATARRTDGYTPIELAMDSLQMEVVAYLSAHGASLDFIDHRGQLYLVSLLHAHRWDVAQGWVARGANVTLVAGEPAESGFEVLFTQRVGAKTPGDIDTLNSSDYRFKKLPRVPRQDTPPTGAQREAMTSDFVQYADRLPADSLPVRVVLNFALQQHDLALLQALYKRGARLTREQALADHTAGGLVISYLYYDSLDILRFLMDQQVDPTLLLPVAANYGRREWVAELLRRGGRLDGGDYAAAVYNWESAAHLAASNADLLEFLFDNGLELAPQSEVSWKVLAAATQAQDARAVQLLLDHGVTAEPPHNFQFPPLEGALVWARADSVRVLRAHGATWRRNCSYEPKLGMVANAAMERHCRNSYIYGCVDSAGELYRALLGYPSWLPMGLLGALLIGLQWRLRRRQQRADPPAAMVAAGAVASAAVDTPQTDWAPVDRGNPPEVERHLQELQTQQQQAAAGLPLGMLNGLAFGLLVAIDPLLSQATVPFLLDWNGYFPRTSGMRPLVDPGWPLMLWCGLSVGFAAIVAGIGAQQAVRRLARGAQWLQLVSSLTLGVLALVGAYGFWHWMPDGAMIITMLFQAGVALVFAVRAWQALRRLRQIRALARPAAQVQPTAAEDRRTEIDVPAGWDEGGGKEKKSMLDE